MTAGRQVAVVPRLNRVFSGRRPPSDELRSSCRPGHHMNGHEPFTAMMRLSWSKAIPITSAVVNGEVRTAVIRLIRLMYPISCSNRYPVLYSNLMPIFLPPTAFRPCQDPDTSIGAALPIYSDIVDKNCQDLGEGHRLQDVSGEHMIWGVSGAVHVSDALTLSVFAHWPSRIPR